MVLCRWKSMRILYYSWINKYIRSSITYATITNFVCGNIFSIVNCNSLSLKGFYLKASCLFVWQTQQLCIVMSSRILFMAIRHKCLKDPNYYKNCTKRHISSVTEANVRHYTYISEITNRLARLIHPDCDQLSLPVAVVLYLNAPEPFLSSTSALMHWLK